MDNYERKVRELHDFDVNSGVVIEVLDIDPNGEPVNLDLIENIAAGPEDIAAGPEYAVEVDLLDDFDEVDTAEYFSDSGVEEDSFNGVETLEGIQRLVSLERFRGDRFYCVNVAYVTIKCVDNDNKKLCYPCFTMHQQTIESGLYEHVSLHLKTKLRDYNYQQYCYLCGYDLHQVIMAEVCVTCNSTE